MLGAESRFASRCAPANLDEWRRGRAAEHGAGGPCQGGQGRGGSLARAKRPARSKRPAPDARLQNQRPATRTPGRPEPPGDPGLPRVTLQLWARAGRQLLRVKNSLKISSITRLNVQYCNINTYFPTSSDAWFGESDPTFVRVMVKPEDGVCIQRPGSVPRQNQRPTRVASF